jgi:Tfp pilus assembly protein PilV
MKLNKSKQGGSVVEIIIALGILVVIIINVFDLYISAANANAEINERLQAETYLQQGFEAVRAIRDYDYENLTLGEHGLSKENGYGSFNGTSDTWGDYTRTITISEGLRDRHCDSTNVAGSGLLSTDITVSESHSDAGQNDLGNPELENLVLEMGQYPWNAMYFTNVAVPQGSEIETANIDFFASESNSVFTALTIFGEDTGSPAGFTTALYDISGRTKTQAVVPWVDVPAWQSGQSYQTPDIRRVIQEIVDRPDWVSGSDIVILIHSDNMYGERNAVAYDDNPVLAPKLSIEYREAGTGSPDPDSRNVEIEVTWNQSKAAPDSIIANQYLRNWANPEICGDESELLILNIGNAYVSNNKNIKGITLTNDGNMDITVDKVTLSWTAGDSVEFIRIENSTVYHFNGTGSPLGVQPSGTEFNVVDVVIPAGETFHIDDIKFDQPIAGSYVTMLVTMQDGSIIFSEFQL